MRGEAFAARVQVALDAAFGSGTSRVAFTGIDPEEAANGVFEVEVRPMFGIVFGLKMSMIDESDPAQFEQGAIQVATFAGRGMAEDFLTLALGLQSATPDMFVLSEAEQALAEVQEIVDEANERVFAAGGVFRAQKRPVAVEAIIVETPTDMHTATDWMSKNLYVGLIGDATQPSTLRYPDQVEDDNSRPDKGWYIDPADGALMIRTLEGDMRVRPGDVVIRGLQGEFYPCKRDIFDASYEPAGEVSE